MPVRQPVSQKIKISGPLYFGSAHYVEHRIRIESNSHTGQKHLLLRMHLVDHCDVSGIHMLESLARAFKSRNGDIYLSGIRPAARDQMELLGFDTFLGHDHFFEHEEAIPLIFHNILDPANCVYKCPVRVFAECQALPKYHSQLEDPLPFIFPDHEVQSWLADELKWFLEQDGLIPRLYLVDVRETEEYEGGHLPEAQSIPLRVIPEKGGALPSDQAIILLCRTGRRSHLAACMLQDMGYLRVFKLQGGMLAWEAAGFPIAIEE